VVKDWKPVLIGVFPQPMLFQWLLDLVASSEWFLRSSEHYVVIAFAGATFSCCLFGALFKLRWMTNNRRRNTT
jgi:hypothetical protein